MKTKEPTYEEALNRLEQIAARMEDGELGVDVLAAHLKEAQSLLALCKKKLFAADEEIQALLKTEEPAD